MFEILIPIIVSLIALAFSLYRELSGPDISLLNPPAFFDLTDKSLHVLEEDVNRWFTLNSIFLVFANQGGKAGTILDLKFEFTPSSEYEPYHNYYSCSIDTPEARLPITIKDGENRTLKITSGIRTIDWKKDNLLSILEKGTPVGKSINQSIIEGRKKFEDFLSDLDKNREIGEFSCRAKLTTGRF